MRPGVSAISRYRDGVERLAHAVEAAARPERGRALRASAGLRAGLELLASDSHLARLLLGDALSASGPLRLEHDRTLARLADALRAQNEAQPGTEPISSQTTRLLAGGLASHLSHRVLAGGLERLPEDHDMLLVFLLTPLRPSQPEGGA